MRSAVRTACAALGALSLGLVVLDGSFATAGRPSARTPRALAAADTDSVRAVLPARALPDGDLEARARRVMDSLRGFTPAAPPLASASDSLGGDTSRVDRYLRSLRRERPYARVGVRRSPLLSPLGASWRADVLLDSTTDRYTVRERVGDFDVRVPVEVGFEQYQGVRLASTLDRNYRELLAQRARQTQQRTNRGLGVSIVVPGGASSAFSTIFGKNEVALRVNGQADVKAGFDYRKSKQQAVLTGKEVQIDPAFQQDLRLGITGTIGDKLRVDVNWDTRNQFDYQNQLSLKYTGYEDEIVRSIEAGNVFLQTPSTLIRGGQSLFGIKSEFQVGGVKLTTVASQQEGQSSSLSLSGGAEKQTFSLRATEYDEGLHFFLSYYFRNQWEIAHSDPPQVQILSQDQRGDPGVRAIEEIEVWRLTNRSVNDVDVRKVIAVADLGEDKAVLTQRPSAPFTEIVAPSADRDQYTEKEIDENIRSRAAGSNPDDFLSAKGLRPLDFQPGSFRLLRRNVDYVLDENLGYLTLTSRLADTEALAVSFRYVSATNARVQVGDFASSNAQAGGNTTENALFVKLLRRTSPTPPTDALLPATWPLEMRNIYSLRSRNVTREGFDLDVSFEPSGAPPTTSLPFSGANGQRTLLENLGLDRLSSGGAPGTDNLFDFNPGFTIDPTRGLLIFPYLEPFGERIVRVAAEANQPAIAQRYAFTELYNVKRERAEREYPVKNVYRIVGEYQGSSQSFFDLRAFTGVVRGSVRVTAGGAALAEGADFTVDYDGGTVTITNPAYLTSGRNIDITYEQNALFNLQKKTLLGARADYALADRLALGATLMQLSQRSSVDKFRIDDEPVSNTIWGVDGRLTLEPRWITRAVDALPFLQTRAPSRFNVQAEFAQLRPGNPQTLAFQQVRRNLQKRDRDFSTDELNGVSFVDDFESFENTYSLRSAGAWSLASVPDSIAAVDRAGTVAGLTGDSLRTNWRGGLAWYTLNERTKDEIGEEVIGESAEREAVANISTQSVFPDRVDPNGRNTPLQTLDFYFDPRMRGPYNYTTRLAEDFFARPKETWGGMVTRIPEGYTDFNLKNVEFVEFVVKPFAENAAHDAGADAALYVDLGRISEDVLPDGENNSEDGLALESASPTTFTAWGRTPIGDANRSPDVKLDIRRTEDLGLDGLASYDPSAYEGGFLESTFFARFLDRLPGGSANEYVAAEVARSRRDPSGDDYHSYLDDAYFQNAEFFARGKATLQQRFMRYFAGQELNSFEAQNQLARDVTEKRGNSRYPDSEDLNGGETTSRDNSYFQFRIPLSRAELARQSEPGTDDDYVIGEVSAGTGWYLIRLPVRQPTRRVGGISDFTNIESIRLWTTGNEVPVTLRFASIDLVGSQWQQSQRITDERVRADGRSAGTRVSIQSVNTDENGTIYTPPLETIRNIVRGNTGASNGPGREQSIAFRVENLQAGRQRAIYKTFNDPVDLLKYDNLRMYAHLHGRDRAEAELTEEDRGRVAMFVRFGSNESTDYYEVEQPLTPALLPAGGAKPNADELWLNALNAMNVRVRDLNVLKAGRDDRLARATGRVRTDSLFYNVERGGTPDEDLPNAEESGPPGTRLGIRGNPTLNRISTIVLGLRSLADSLSTNPDDAVREVVLWANELRVSGYDEANGWSALGNLDLGLADFASVRANVQTQTDGFGALTSTLGERDQTATLSWSAQTDVQMHRVLPERYGWSLPVQVSAQSRTSTPRFSPARGDVRLDNLLDGINDRRDENGNPLPSTEREEIRRRELEAAQDYQTQRSLSFSIDKEGSKSVVLQNTLDATRLSYSTNRTDARSPSTAVNEAWQWSSGANFQLPTKQPRTIKPLWFLKVIPLVGGVGNLKFNYVPTTFGASATAARNFATTRQRRPFVETAAAQLTPERVRFPFRDQHGFQHSRDFSLQYNPFSFLRTQFDTDVSQSLSLLGIDSLFSAVRVVDGVEQVTPISGVEAREILARRDSAVFVDRRILAVPIGQTLGRAFSGDDRMRTEQYSQNFTGTLSPRLPRSLNWLVLSDVAFNARYSWQNAPVGRPDGANIGNQVTVASGLTLRPQTLFQKFGFYKTLEEEQRAADAASRARVQRAEAERTAARQRRIDERAARRAARADTTDSPSDSTDVLPDSLRDDLPAARQAPETPVARRPNTIRLDDPLPVAADSASADSAGAAPERKRRGLKIPFPSGRTLVRRTVLTLGGVTDMRVQYTGGFNAQATNVAEAGDSTRTPYGFFDAVRGRGPSLLYRFGLERRVSAAERVLNSRLQIADALTDNHKLTASTTLRPTPTLNVNVTWDAQWRQNETIQIRPGANGGDVVEIRALNGDTKSYIWAFGADYRKFFAAQVGTLRGDLAGSEAGPILDADENGRQALTPQSLTEDFRKHFTRGLGSIDGKGFLPIPMPAWQVTYTGAANWPLLRRFARSASLRTGYSADFGVPGYRTNPGGLQGQVAVSLSSGGRGGTRTITYEQPEFEAGSVNVSERFAPLVGLDVQWKNQLSTNFAINRSNLYGLSTSSRDVTRNSSDELSLTVNYQKQGIRLPFARNRLNNRATFSLTLARSVADNVRYLTSRAVAAAISDNISPDDATRGDYVSIAAASERLVLNPTIGYQFSNTVQGNFSLRYEKFSSEQSNTPGFTTMNGTFNIRVNISSN